MSFAGSRNCKCPRWDINTTGQAKREWVVVQRNQNRSSYNQTERLGEYGWIPKVERSYWSHVLCLTCGWHWRTQAFYVDRLPDLSEEGQQLCYRQLKPGKPAGKLLLAKIADTYNRPLFGAESSPSRSTRARNQPAKRAIGKESRR